MFCEYIWESHFGDILSLAVSLAYAGFHAAGVLQGAEWSNLDKSSPKQANLTIFASDPQGAHAPFTPPDMPVNIGVDLKVSSLEVDCICKTKAPCFCDTQLCEL